MKKKRNKLIISIVAIFITLVIINIYKFKDEKPVQPKVINGVINLTDWDFDKNGNVELNGEWEFYWNQLLEPSDFSPITSDKKLIPTGYIKVPASWNCILDKTSISSKGVGTYHLKIKVKPEDTIYGMKITNIRMSNRLFVNNRPLAGCGTPALKASDSITNNIPYTAFFSSDKEYIDIIIQVSDFDYLSGGIIKPIYFGKQFEISILNLKMIVLDLVDVVALIMTGLYFMGVFVFRKREISLLYFSIYCICFAVFTFTYNEKVFEQMFPNISFMSVMKVKGIILYICFSALCLFINENGDNFFPRKILNIYLTSFFCFDIIVFINPLSVYSKYENFMSLVGFSANLLITFYLIKAIIKKEYGSLINSQVKLLCISSIFIIIHSASCILYNNTIIESYKIPSISLVLFTFTISLYISKRHSDLYTAVEEMNEKLILIDKTKDEFLINTSHELKTPLHGIINITQATLDNIQKSSYQKQTENLSYVITTAKRLTSLINDIIDFQSIKSNSLHLNIKAFDINAIVQTVIEVFQIMYCDKEILIVNNVSPNIYFVMADEDRVRQIIYNLLGNALKYTDQGKIQIEAVDMGNSIKISILDTGIGIKKELHETIFEYFEHSTEIRFKENYSTGLGLPIARKLAILMDGKLYLEESQIGKGSKFSFTLPKASVNNEVISIQEVDLTNNNDIHDKVIKYTDREDNMLKKNENAILIVDDEISNIKVIKNIFINENYEIIYAFNGEQALEALKNHRNISLILLDVMMPDMSGFDFCRRIRVDYSLFELPIILLTVRNTPEDITIGFESGANDFLVKPFNSNELKARVRTLMELKQSVENSISAKTAFLSSQMKPHFIYNALTAIMSLCYIDGEQAGKLIGDFSNYLRCSFDFDPYSSYVSLETELSMIESYIAIEKARFGERLNIVYDIEEELCICNIPALILQPLVENAIVHGLMKSLDGGTVEIKAWGQDGYINFNIRDNGIGMSSEKIHSLYKTNMISNGVGFINIHQRLLQIYGQGLEIKSEEGIGTIVSLKLPYDKL